MKKYFLLLIIIILTSCSPFTKVSEDDFINQSNKNNTNPVLSFPITSNPSSNSDIANSIFLESDFIYIAGNESGTGNRGWRIEKRYKSNGKLVSSFGTNGFINSNPSDNEDTPTNLLIDEDYIYIAGCDETPGNEQWRIEKRDKNSGLLDNNFGNNGVIQINTIDQSGYSDFVCSMIIDSSYLYLVGPYNLRIEKRDKVTGNLISSFGNNGVIIVSNAIANSITTDTNYIYTAGYDFNNGNDDMQWRIEKRDKITGQLINNFGTNGIINYNLINRQESANSIINDSNYIYISGEDTKPNNQQWRIEKRDKTTGQLINNFGTNGVLEINPTEEEDYITSIILNYNFLYLIGVTNSDIDENWRIEKRNATTGDLIEDFGDNGVIIINPSFSRDGAKDIAIDSNYIYVAGYDDCNFNYQWRIERFIN